MVENHIFLFCKDGCQQQGCLPGGMPKSSGTPALAASTPKAQGSSLMIADPDLRSALSSGVRPEQVLSTPSTARKLTSNAVTTAASTASSVHCTATSAQCTTPNRQQASAIHKNSTAQSTLALPSPLGTMFSSFASSESSVSPCTLSTGSSPSPGSVQANENEATIKHVKDQVKENR